MIISYENLMISKVLAEYILPIICWSGFEDMNDEIVSEVYNFSIQKFSKWRNVVDSTRLFCIILIKIIQFDFFPNCKWFSKWEVMGPWKILELIKFKDIPKIRGKVLNFTNSLQNTRFESISGGIQWSGYEEVPFKIR